MSKSRGNVVNPDEVVEKYGADAFRVYALFMGPFEQMIAWEEKALRGVRRFLEKVWKTILLYENVPRAAVRRLADFGDARLRKKTHISAGGASSKLSSNVHRLIKKVSEDIESLKFNTAIAALMEYLNQVKSQKLKVKSQEVKTFLKLLAPFAPHITEELWELLGEKDSIHQQPWPKYDPRLIKEEEVTVVIQVNGKLRETLRLSFEEALKEEKVIALAKKAKRVQKYLQGQKIKKTIFLGGKLVNFVVK